MSTVKRQHYVPQFLLRGFTDDNDSLTVYQRGKGLLTRNSTDNVALQRYYYATTNKAGEIDTQTVESRLSQIEGAGSAVIQRLINGDNISTSARNDFAIFLTSQDFRSPRRRQEFAEMQLGIEHHRFNAKTVKSLESYVRAVSLASESNETFDISKISKESKLTVEEDGTISIRLQDTIQALSAAEKFAPVVLGMDWHIYHAPRGQKFIISDSPVQLYESPDTLGDFSGPAYCRLGTCVSLPLSSTVCFVASHPAQSKVLAFTEAVQIKTATGAEVRFFNQTQIDGCLNQLYASSNFDWLNKKTLNLPTYESRLSFIPKTEEGRPRLIKTKR